MKLSKAHFIKHLETNLGTIYSQNRLFYNKDEKKIIIDGNVFIILKNPKAEINANKLIMKIDENENITNIKAIDEVNVKIQRFHESHLFFLL